MKNLATGRQAFLEFGMVLVASLVLTSSLAGSGSSSVTTAGTDTTEFAGPAVELDIDRAPTHRDGARVDDGPTSESAPDPRPGPAPRAAAATGPTPNQALASTADLGPDPTPPATARPTSDAGSESGAASDATTSSADPGPAPLARPVVILYGDSLAWEARHVFEDALAASPDVDVVTRTFGGTAICDWLDEMTADAAGLQPGMVVIEFVGNNFTPCMQDADGAPLRGDALVEKYTRDAHAAAEVFTSIGTQVVFAGAPVSLAGMGPLDSDDAPLNLVYAALGSDRPDVHFVDAGAAVLADGHWTATLPCLPEEPCAGTDGGPGPAHNPVRSPDTLHFCPAADAAGNTVTGECPVWSSGAYRYGTALAQPVIESIEARRR